MVVKELLVTVMTCLEGNFGSTIRHIVYSRFLKKSGHFHSEAGMKINGARNVSIGEGCSFGRGVLIQASKSIVIGDNVLIAPYVIIVDANHSYKLGSLIKNQDSVRKETRIGNNVWIGTHSTVLAGVRIGSNSVIAAHSLVNKSVPANEVWGGVPARFIKRCVK